MLSDHQSRLLSAPSVPGHLIGVFDAAHLVVFGGGERRGGGRAGGALVQLPPGRRRAVRQQLTDALPVVEVVGLPESDAAVVAGGAQDGAGDAPGHAPHH